MTQAVSIYHKGSEYCCYDDTILANFSPWMLTSEYWQKKNLVIDQAHGRGITWFVKHQENELVLRHYYRGGLAGKLINDSYWFKSYATTRAVIEYNLLSKLTSLGLPVPLPVACRVIKKGLFYTNDLLMGRIKNAHNLVEILSEKAIPEKLWQNIGATIKTFHQHGVFHHDLNAYNILVDHMNKVWLIDFDKCEQRTVDNSWQNMNLERLKRSLLSEQTKRQNFYFQKSNFKQLSKGYQEKLGDIIKSNLVI